MDNLEIYDNAGLILENVTAVDVLLTETEQEAALTQKCPCAGYYIIAMRAMLDKIREYIGIIQEQAQGDFK